MEQNTTDKCATRVLADNLPIWRCTADKLCDYFNTGWLAFTGRNLEQELGFGWAEGVHPDDYEQCLAAFQAAFDARAPFWLKYHLRRYDGAYRLVLDHGVPFADSEGAFAGYIGACMDIQDHVRAEEDTRAAPTDREAPLVGLPGAALNMLQTIISLLGLKARRLKHDAAAEHLRSVAHYILTVGVVQQELSRKEMMGQVDLGSYLASVSKVLVAAHGRGDIRVIAEVEPVWVATVQAATLGTVVNELLTNSIKHAFQGRKTKTILVKVGSIRGGGAEVTVADDGIGIEPKLYPFGKEGSNGMALVAALARQANASVKVDGQGGTRFTLTVRDIGSAISGDNSATRRRDRRRTA